MKIVRNMIGVLLIFVVFSSNLWATPTVEEIMKKVEIIKSSVQTEPSNYLRSSLLFSSIKEKSN